MSDLQGQPGELRMTVQITRKNGQVETHELIGRPIPAEQESQHGSDSQHGGPERGD